MASSGDIIPQILLDPCSNTVCATVKSGEPRHWYLLWSPYPAKKIPNYKTTRGVTQVCGYKWEVSGWNCEEQQEEGETLEHTFCWDNTPFDTEYHFMISETCSPRTGFFTSAPLVYRFQECEPGYRGYKVTSPTSGNFPTSPNLGGMQWNQEIYNPSGCAQLPSVSLRMCGSGLWTFRMSVWTRIPFGSPATSFAMGVTIAGEGDIVLGVYTQAANTTMMHTGLRSYYNSDFGVTLITPFVQNLGDFGIQLWAQGGNRHEFTAEI